MANEYVLVGPLLIGSEVGAKVAKKRVERSVCGETQVADFDQASAQNMAKRRCQ
jgi:hypothetical protein